MPDIVKYGNSANDYPVFKLTEVEQNIFMTLLSYQTFTQSQTIETNLYDILDKLGGNRNTSLAELEQLANSLIIKICNPKFSLITDEKIIAFVCFDKVEYDRKTYDLKVHIQDDFYQIIKNHKMGFTRFELAEFITLSGNFTKTLYRHLKQYRIKGFWAVPIEEFRRLLNIPDSYKMCDIDKRVLKPAIKQLSREHDLFDTVRVPFRNLKVEKIKKTGRRTKGGRGGTIVALKFTFDAEKLKKIPEHKKDVHSEKTLAQVTSSLTAQKVTSKTADFKAEQI